MGRPGGAAADEWQYTATQEKYGWEARGPRWVHWLLDVLHGKPNGHHGTPWRRFVHGIRCKFFCWFCHDARHYLRARKEASTP